MKYVYFLRLTQMVIIKGEHADHYPITSMFNYL